MSNLSRSKMIVEIKQSLPEFYDPFCTIGESGDLCASDDGIWTCRDGRQIRYEDLEPDHHKAILNMLYKQYVARFEAECSDSMRVGHMLHGEAALDGFDVTFDQFLEGGWQQFAHLKFWNLLDLAIKKGYTLDKELRKS